MPRLIIWFKRDLRLLDHPALAAAVAGPGRASLLPRPLARPPRPNASAAGIRPVNEAVPAEGLAGADPLAAMQAQLPRTAVREALGERAMTRGTAARARP